MRSHKVFFLLAGMLLAGCTGLSALQGSSPNIYVLDARPIVSASAVKRDLVLAVNMPQARPGFATTQIVYLQQPHELNYFANSRWTDTPAHMLQPLLLQALEQSAAFRAVVPTASAILADVRLDVELIRLQHDFTTHPSRVQIILQAQLIDVRGKRVLAVQQFDATENAGSEDAYGGVSAANRLVQRVLGQVAEFCVTASGGQQ
ncbi:MAG TPA: ABC-type transport auxiliary lipoprotein family protein [Gallionella sp.]|nr:ABC-type transport auxiliary lipoprotein family protein [Gallionella sp.]